MTTPPTCSCGDPATQQIVAGHTNHGGTWRTHYAWLCDPCAIEDHREHQWSHRQ